MAEIIENMEHKEVPSMAKANAGLTLGIIGTALSGLTALGGLGNMAGLFGNATKTTVLGVPNNDCHVLTNEEIYLERSQAQNYIDITKEFYQNKIDANKEMALLFFDAYKRDADNSFSLYKYTRDSNDALAAKIGEVDKKVDIMAAVRPYQDALIDSKINQNALIADFNLSRRTCKMIEGQLVLPSTPEVTGYGSYSSCKCNGGL